MGGKYESFEGVSPQAGSRMTQGVAADTIAALATSARQGGVGIVRVSGADAAAIIGRIAPSLPSPAPSHRLLYTTFTDGSGAPIDDGYAVFFAAPRSYTAEDVVELHGHGGAANLGRLLRAVLATGARAAERGEFTLRAFLNGRIDLSQAEAVLDVVQAKTETALDLAHRQLRGGLSSRVTTIRDALLGVLARLEVQIDFTEEELDGVHGERPIAPLASCAAAVVGLCGTFERGRVLRDGAKVVLMGLPNAGKSSLFNALLRQSRAIVTEIPGTTRDFIEETLDLDGIPVTLIDTAGVHDGVADVVEAAGVERSWALAQDADLVLWVVDGQREEPVSIPSMVHDTSDVLVVRTKSDLGRGDVSAVTGDGLEVLVAELRARLLPAGTESADHVLVTSARHFQALRGASEALDHAIAAAPSEAPELVAIDVREALTQLGLIIGETTTEDLLDRIFGEFCIGK